MSNTRVSFSMRLIKSITVSAIAALALVSQIESDYVTVIIERDSHVIDIVSIDLDDSRVARAIFEMTNSVDDYDAVAVTEINALTRLITHDNLARVCSELSATDIECFA